MAGGAAASAARPLWLSGDDDAPRGCAATRSSLEGTLRRPDDAGFADALRTKASVVQLQRTEVERLGASPNPFVRATQVFRSFVGRSIARLFPPKEAGLLLGLVLGDDSQLDPGIERDFHATGLGHLLVVSGENVAMVLAPVLGVRRAAAARAVAAVPLWPSARWPSSWC